MIGFSEIPESFERDTVVTQYINTLALDFGVDVREFWPVSSSSLGTASESEIQHMKAKGKGPGEFISVTERNLNAEFPETVQFEYDTQDIGEDKIAAEVAQAWIQAYLPLTKAGAMMSSPGGSMASGNTTVPADRGNAAELGPGADVGIISNDDFLRLLSDKGVLPDYIVDDGRLAIMDTEVYITKDQPVVKIVWKEGKLTQQRLPPIRVPSNQQQPVQNPIVAEIVKGGPGSGHHGHAGRPGKIGGSLPDGESGNTKDSYESIGWAKFSGGKGRGW
ncbi:MAG: hypothetical protein SVK08_14055, partial [Halobacteriota archaeon]|nr:hypothetical protein [Halobacteriota archaeon]